MQDPNDHLSLEEIFAVLRSDAGTEGPATGELREHLNRCHQCGEVAEQYRGVMERLDQYRRAGESTRGLDCPPAATWTELAARIVPPEEAEASLEHAAECSACSAQLKAALEIVGASSGPPPQLVGVLKSNTSRWQQSLSRRMELRSRGLQEPARVATWPKAARSRWAWAAIAAGIVVAAGVAAYVRLSQASPEKLLAEAYTRQRTIELRINGAPYGPIRVQRDRGSSQLNAASQLLDAEVVIKKRLEKQPEVADFLREKAEVDLLNWDYQPAIETLGRALRLQPQSFLITLDLGTAHFERAEATNSPADYEASLNYLGDAIRLEPANPAALFNRAIVYERLYLYGRAIEDWEQFLKIEKDAGWRKEAEQRLKELRTREQKRSQKQSPETLSLVQFTDDVKTRHATGIEEYLEVAERQILPRILPKTSPVRYDDPNYQAANVLADELQSAHGDRFLKDLLHDASQPAFLPGVRLLGKSSTANHEGRSEEAYTTALKAAALFQRSGNTAGLVAAGFEEAYALQFQSRAASCEPRAGELVKTAFQRGYAGLEIQLRLEEAICANMNREIGSAKNLVRQALTLAKEHGYQSLYLRGLVLLAGLEYEAGNEESAWSAIREGLGLYWSAARVSTLRAYSFYALLDKMTEQIGHPNVQFAAAFEALQFQNPSLLLEASERARMGDAALRLGDAESAEAQLRQAQKFFATLPQTDSVRWRELEVRLWLAHAQALRGADTSQAEASLLASLPEVERISNRYIESRYYFILADLKLRSGDAVTGQRFLLRAIQVADTGLQSLSSMQERRPWMDQHRRAYLVMTELLFRSGSPGLAHTVWEHFRSADGVPLPRNFFERKSANALFAPAAVAAQPSPGATIITYAFADDGLMIWTRHVDEIHSAYLPVSPSNLLRAAENLISECSRPDSDISNLRADAKYLYKWLFQPVRQWLPQTGHIIIEPDGVLGVMPFEALIDDGGSYLGVRYTITIASSIRARERRNGTLPIQRSDRALIAAAPAGIDGSMRPAPGAIQESRYVAGLFNKPLTLAGNQVEVSRVGRELPRSAVFHFAGHAGLSRSGASMLMADGILGSDQARAFDEHKLRKLKLAVFSACGTAKASELSASDSLVTAFLQAGAQNVVASRWNVDSMATEDFIELFYKAALSGASIASAIQSAADAFRTTPERAHPYYWAAFAAYGSA